MRRGKLFALHPHSGWAYDNRRRAFAGTLTAFLILMSLAAVSAPAEEIAGPFVARSSGYPVGGEILDQHADATYGAYLIWITQCRAQVFTPSVSGSLSKVGLRLAIDSDTNVMFTLQIRHALAGVPGGIGDIYYSTDLSANNLEETPGSWHEWELVTPPTLYYGQEYAIVLVRLSSDFNWMWDYGIYGAGDGFTSYDDGENWDVPNNEDHAFRTYMVIEGNGISKVAWHSNGNYALGVTGQDSSIWEYDRMSGTWSAISDTGDCWYDIAYNPALDLFYAVGHVIYVNGNTDFFPVAVEIDPYTFDLNHLGGPDTKGAFRGVCSASNGYAFLAVGNNDTSSGALASWYSPGTGWTDANLGDIASSDGHVLNDVDWDRQSGGSYYAVGTDGAWGVIYKFPSPGSTGPVMLPNDNQIAHHGIEWQPAAAGAGYAIIVGDAGPLGNIQRFDGSAHAKLHETGETMRGVSWHPQGGYAIIVGQDSMDRAAAYRHNAGDSHVICLSHLLPPGTGPLAGVAMKGPSSPSSGIIVGSGGGIGFFPSAINTDTRLNVNVVLPEIRWIGFNDTDIDRTSRMGDQVDVGAWYYFMVFGNYSQGWENCRMDVEAWYDYGEVGANSTYPAEGNSTRNLAFRLSYVVATGNYSCTSPNNGTEIQIGGFFDDDMLDNSVNGQHNHTVGLEIFFGNQIRAANGTGTGYGRDPNTGLIKQHTWDFCVKLSDARYYPSGQINMSYGEFGIKQKVSIAVQNNPSGNGPPGAPNVPLGSSYINYSSNDNYRVNVSIPHLYLEGNTGSPYLIGAGNLSVQNFAPFVNGTNSEIWTLTPIQGPGMSRLVWGAATPLEPVGNGTTSNGPFVSDFNAAGLGVAAITEIRWWVNIPAGIPEGTYWALITICVYTD